MTERTEPSLRVQDLLIRQYFAETEFLPLPPPEDDRPITMMTDDERVQAEGKALKLLMSYLTTHQKMTMARHGFFYEVGGSTWYVLYDGLQLLQLTGDGHPHLFRGIFIAPNYPRGDRLLSQLLMLRAIPDLVRTMACSAPAIDTWRLHGRPLHGSGNIMPLLKKRTYWPDLQL